MIEYVIIGLLAVLIALSVIGLIVVLKKKSGGDSSSYGRLEAKLEGQEKAINQKIELTFAEKMTSVSKEIGQNSERSLEQLATFQKGMSETLSTSLLSMNKTLNERVDKMNEALTNRVMELSGKIDKNLLDINKKVDESLQNGFKQNSEAMTEVKTRLVKIDEAQKNLDSLQKQVVSLNNVLSNNQTRGQYGELQLEMLLESTFPDGKGKYYEIQDDIGIEDDGFKRRPDATIIFQGAEGQIKLCIDSKFPFADYQKLFAGEEADEAERQVLSRSFKQAVRGRIKEVASKYIIHGKTVDSAVVFIPNDGVYAYISSHYPDLLSEARSEHVIVSCPSTLQAIIVLFHNAAVDSERNKNLKIINEELGTLGKEFGRFIDRWNDLSKTISTLEKRSTEFGTTVKKIGNRFDAISKNQLPSPTENTIDYEEKEPGPSGDPE